MRGRPRFRLRIAQPSDLELLVVHRRGMWEAIGGFSVRALDAADPAYRRWVRRMMRSRRFVAWIAEEPGGHAIGSGAVWLTEAQPRPMELGPWRPYLLSMYTDPQYRGFGVASAIVRAAIRFARAGAHTRIDLHASKMGRPVYEQLGFTAGREMRLILSPALARARRRRR